MSQYHCLLTGRFFNDDHDAVSQIKHEECPEDLDFYTPIAENAENLDGSENGTFIPYECSNLAPIISAVLNLPESDVDWVAHNQPAKFEHLMLKAKRKLYRERARNRTVQPVTTPLPVHTEPKKAKRGRKPLKQIEKQNYASQESDSERQNDKKAIQMIRNRISAQNSRDRKKAYLKELEQHTQKCCEENMYLKAQIEEFQKRNKELSTQNNAVQRCLSMLMQVCKKSQNQAFLDLASQIQQLQEDSDTNPQDIIQSRKKIKTNY